MNILGKTFIKGHVSLYRISGGKLGSSIKGMPVILLTTRGRKSGEARTVPLVPFIDGDNVYVMGSMGGAPAHPAWFKNIEQTAEVEVQRGADTYTARAVVLPDAERAQVWPQVKARYPNFGEYEKKTSRQIPVVQLVRQA
jgi:deazaflavin-dependent oxidoreductase (nitroreductase family)